MRQIRANTFAFICESCHFTESAQKQNENKTQLFLNYLSAVRGGKQIFEFIV